MGRLDRFFNRLVGSTAPSFGSPQMQAEVRRILTVPQGQRPGAAYVIAELALAGYRLERFGVDDPRVIADPERAVEAAVDHWGTYGLTLDWVNAFLSVLDTAGWRIVPA